MSRLLGVCLLASVLVCCASASPEAQKVRVTTNYEAVRGCRFLGNVRDEAVVGGEDRAEDLLKQKTFDLGGNVLIVNRADKHFGGGIKAAGEAYRCETGE